MARTAKPRATGAPESLGKKEIIDLWENLDPIDPQMEPMPSGHTGTSYFSDTIRLTGSREFVESVLSNLRPLLRYNSNGSRLDVLYRQAVDKVSGEVAGSWSFYCKARARSGSRGRPSGSLGKKNRERIESTVKTTVTPQRQLEGPTPPAQGKPESINGRPDKVTETEIPGVNTPIQGPRPKGYRKPTPAPSTVSTVPPANRNGKNDPVYGIGVRDDDGWIWTEPGDTDGYPCDVYPDIESCNDAINSLTRGKHGIKDALEIVEIVKVGGKVRFNSV